MGLPRQQPQMRGGNVAEQFVHHLPLVAELRRRGRPGAITFHQRRQLLLPKLLVDEVFRQNLRHVFEQRARRFTELELRKRLDLRRGRIGRGLNALCV